MSKRDLSSEKKPRKKTQTKPRKKQETRAVDEVVARPAEDVIAARVVDEIAAPVVDEIAAPVDDAVGEPEERLIEEPTLEPIGPEDYFEDGPGQHWLRKYTDGRHVVIFGSAVLIYGVLFALWNLWDRLSS